MLSIIFSAVDMTDGQKIEFEKLYYKYRRLLFTVIRKIAPTDTDAEDILQNTFIKIAKNIKNIDGLESKETVSFLVIIAKSEAYDFLRKQARVNEIPIEEASGILADDNSINDLVSNLQYKKIVSVIKGIQSPYMEVLYFHFVKDYSLKQTARLLDRKAETVKMQMVRGKKILVKKLSEVLYE